MRLRSRDRRNDRTGLLCLVGCSGRAHGDSRLSDPLQPRTDGSSRADGGGIFSAGTTTLNDSTVSDTIASGGGIVNIGTVTLKDSPGWLLGFAWP